MQPFVNSNKTRHQQGVAAVEFALVAMLFFTLLFAILEFGRLFYLQNAVQEVTRRAAREATVRWVTAGDEVRNLALFEAANLPAGPEITAENIVIEYLDVNQDVIGNLPDSPLDNVTACLKAENNCIAYVRVSITEATYSPMIALFSAFSVPITTSTVTMPAESLGY